VVRLSDIASSLGRPVYTGLKRLEREIERALLGTTVHNGGLGQREGNLMKRTVTSGDD
jgi:hypothetical protein